MDEKPKTKGQILQTELENLKIVGRERDNNYNRAIEDAINVAKRAGVIEPIDPSINTDKIYKNKGELDELFEKFREGREPEEKRTSITK